MKKILYSILILLVIIFLVLIYARFIGTIGIRTNEIVYANNIICDSYNGMKIVHFSDLHYKKAINENTVKKLIKNINKIKPDLIVFTGDLLDKNYKLNSHDTKFLIKELSKLDSKYGNFSVLGDNDYSKADTVKNIYIQSSFTLLENDYSIIYNENNDKIFLGGISTYKYEEADIDKVMSYFNNNSDIDFKILMVHESNYVDKILKNYTNVNLIFAGHSINGSVNIPLINYLLTPNESKKYYKSHYKINNTDLYVSNGIGFNKINFRLFNHPSINFYRLRKED